MSQVQRRPSKLTSLPPPTAESMAIDKHSDAMTEVATALKAVATEIAATRLQQKPMHDFFGNAGDALTCARANLKKWGPWLLGSIPFIISFVNGFSPQAAKFIQFIVTALGNLPQ